MENFNKKDFPGGFPYSVAYSKAYTNLEDNGEEWLLL